MPDSQDIVRTSVTHPLRFDCVTSPVGAGTIGMTICPGRKGSSLQGGRWDRDLAVDLAAVRTWGPDVAIALLQDFEFEILGIPQFEQAVIDAGLPWLFLPIADGSIPDAEFEQRWLDAGPHVRNILRRGGKVMIHCRAGLGRTGLVAANLLVDFGATPEDAIAACRAARTGSIETTEQEAYVERHRPLPARPNRPSQIEGCMNGAAIGDAIGSAFEFLDAETIEAELGEPFAWHYLNSLPGSLLRDHAAGTPTDDTAMALSVANVIAASKTSGASSLTAADFATAFLRDLDRKTGAFGTMFWTGGPGVATMGALSRLAAGADPATCGGRNDGGNGAAMRAHPVGVLGDRAEALRVAEIQAKVTHGHPAAVEAAKAVAMLVYDALAGFEPELEPPYGIVEPEFVDAWRKAHVDLVRDSDRLPDHLLEVAMSGWATVAAAHAISFVYQGDPKRAIAAAAASGADTDTIASIVGAIAGARCGADVFAGEWTSGLTAAAEVRTAIDALST